MFAETLKYWTKRKKTFGDKSVGNVAEDHVKQGAAIGMELTKLLGDRFWMHGLDYGCGWGRITPYLTPHCGHLWALDLFSDWTDRVNATAPTVTASTISGYKLPFPDRTFDVVFDIMTLQSVNEKDREQAAGELARVTEVGGTIFTLCKQEIARADDSAIVKWLDVRDDLWCNLDTIDKKRELYCLIRGTKL
jgi:ubiquinone/menaquinone biosynthesis C-methylase UbiE